MARYLEEELTQRAKAIFGEDLVVAAYGNPIDWPYNVTDDEKFQIIKKDCLGGLDDMYTPIYFEYAKITIEFVSGKIVYFQSGEGGSMWTRSDDYD